MESPMMRDAIYSLRGRNEAVHRYDLEQQVIHKIQGSCASYYGEYAEISKILEKYCKDKALLDKI